MQLELSRFCLLLFDRAWARVLAFGFGVAVDQFDHRHRGIITVTVAGLDDADIAARPVCVTLCQGRHQLVCEHRVLQRGDRPAAVGETAVFAARDQPFDKGAQILRFGQGCPDLLVLDQRRSEILEHRFAVGGFAAEAAAAKAVTHGTLNTVRRGAWPVPRYSRAASWGSPSRDEAPSEPTPP